MMETSIKSEFEWKRIESAEIVLPSELTAYYIYKYKIDSLNKKTNLVKEDASFLKNYYLKIGGRIDVSKSDFRE